MLSATTMVTGGAVGWHPTAATGDVAGGRAFVGAVETTWTAR